MQKYKIISALGLYSTFLFIGHQGPLAARAHAEEVHPLVVLAPAPAVEVMQPLPEIAATDVPQVLGASTAAPSVLFYNPVQKLYESTPSNLDEAEVKSLRTCISKQESFDITKFEKCYEGVYTRVVLQDHSHTHKKHSVKLINKNEHAERHHKVRKHQPRTV